jgi:hypothetical protein
MNASFSSYLNPKLEVRESQSGGKGVFASGEIKANELLSILGGCVMPASDEVGDWALQVDENMVIWTPPGEDVANDPSSFFNHSCNPNAGIKGQIMLVAMKNIFAGAEITFDYAMVLHPSVGCSPNKMKCTCGAPNSRGMITDEDWRLPELQRRYDGWFSFNCQEKIDSQKTLSYERT